MPQFLVLAYEGIHSGASDRRQDSYSAHHADLRLMVEKGEIIAGAEILNDSGDTIGSAMFVNFASRVDLDNWLARKPRVKNEVWKSIEIKPVNKVFTEHRSFSKSVLLFLNKVFDYLKNGLVIKGFITAIGLIIAPSLLFYIMISSYSNRYSIPIYDSVQQLGKCANLLYWYAVIFVLVFILYFIMPLILRLSFPVKSINTIAIFRLPKIDAFSWRATRNILKLYGRFALPLTSPGSVTVLIFQAWLVYSLRKDPEMLPEWLNISLSFLYSLAAIGIGWSSYRYFNRIRRRFQKVRGLISGVQAEKYISNTRSFIILSTLLSLVIFPIHIVFVLISARNEQLLLVLLAPVFTILYYMLAVVVSGFHSSDESTTLSVAQQQLAPTYHGFIRRIELMIIRKLRAKKALWIAPLIVMVLYLAIYPGLGRHTGFVLSYLNIGGGRPITIYVEDSKKDIFNTDMWDERIERNEHIFRYPLRPMRLILLGESKTYVYDDQAGGCPTFGEANTGQCASTFFIPNDIITSTRMPAPEHLP